jgi:hypothetical protein
MQSVLFLTGRRDAQSMGSAGSCSYVRERMHVRDFDVVEVNMGGRRARPPEHHFSLAMVLLLMSFVI